LPVRRGAETRAGKLRHAARALCLSLAALVHGATAASAQDDETSASTVKTLAVFTASLRCEIAHFARRRPPQLAQRRALGASPAASAAL